MNRISLVIAGIIATLPMAAWAAPCWTGTITSIGNAPTVDTNGWTIVVTDAVDPNKTTTLVSDKSITFDTAKGAGVFDLGVSGYLSGASAEIDNSQHNCSNTFDMILLK